MKNWVSLSKYFGVSGGYELHLNHIDCFISYPLWGHKKERKKKNDKNHVTVQIADDLNVTLVHNIHTRGNIANEIPSS